MLDITSGFELFVQEMKILSLQRGNLSTTRVRPLVRIQQTHICNTLIEIWCVHGHYIYYMYGHRQNGFAVKQAPWGLILGRQCPYGHTTYQKGASLTTRALPTGNQTPPFAPAPPPPYVHLVLGKTRFIIK